MAKIFAASNLYAKDFLWQNFYDKNVYTFYGKIFHNKNLYGKMFIAKEEKGIAAPFVHCYLLFLSLLFRKSFFYILTETFRLFPYLPTKSSFGKKTILTDCIYLDWSYFFKKRSGACKTD